VVDFGAQYAQLIARRVRECHVYSEIVPSTMPVAEMLAKRPKAVILSGGPASVYAEGAPPAPPGLFGAGVPVLGICYGFQLMVAGLGGTVMRTGTAEYGATVLVRGDDPPEPPDPGGKPFPPDPLGPPNPLGPLGSPDAPRRFTLAGLTALIEGAGLHPGQAHGVRIFSGLVPAALVDGDPGSAEALRALEAAAALTPPLRDIAAQLHILGYR